MPEIFVQKYPADLPDLRNVVDVNVELELLTETEGVCDLPRCPAAGVRVTEPPTREKAKTTKSLYLWVVSDSPARTRIACELDSRAVNEKRKRICHTNLTGGAAACGGGELWFATQDTLYLCGLSGRYRIRSAEKLKDVADMFVRYGYKVCSLGYNNKQGKPRRSYREGESCWIMPS